jgi:hypothetical protein
VVVVVVVVHVAENLSLLGTRFVENPSHRWENRFAEVAETLPGEVAESLAAGVAESLLVVETLSAGTETPRVVVARTPLAAVEDRLRSLVVADS